MNTLKSVLTTLGIVAFIMAIFLIGMHIRERLQPPVAVETPAELGLKFSNLATECFRYATYEGQEGYVWLCDNGHIEYDSTGIKFPTLTTRTTTVIDPEE